MATVVRWNPVREMAQMQTAMDRMFDEMWRGNWPGGNGDGTLALDAYESESEYRVIATIPGLTAEQINVRLHDGTLTISAELPRAEVPEGTRVLAQERGFGTFSRSIALPQAVTADAIDAHYQDGVLTLTLPKAEAVQPKRIEIKSGNILRSAN